MLTPIMAPPFRVFISAVTSEFDQARDALAASLRARELVLRVQSDFRQEAETDTTLSKLHHYIKDCQAVVCIIGKRSGAMPTAAEAEPFRAMLPPGVTEASYTQWEFFFARHYKRRLSLYIADKTWKPERESTVAARLPLQRALIRHIVQEKGLDRHYFDTVDKLRADVLMEKWPAERPHRPVVLPYPTLGPLFKGRDDFMRRLRGSLTRDGNTTTTAIVHKAVHGLGGVGKTRAAVEYAHAYAHEYSAVALLDADTPDKLRAALAQLIGPLRLTGLPPEEDVRVQAAIDWLNDNPGWFLILDNIDSSAALDAAHHLLGRLRGGQAVLTSRLTQFPSDIEELDLDVLTLEDAADFLLVATASRPKAADDAEQARALAGELGQLALALEMAAATIRTRRMSIAQYRTLWQGNRGRVVGWASQEITGYHHAVAETWQTSVDQLGPEALALLERLSFLAPDPIPGTLLDAKAEGVPNGEDARAALDDLAKYSLATVDPSDNTFLLHRLVQDVTRRGLERTDRHHQRLTEALGQVYAAFAIGNAGDVRVWPLLDPLAPHAESVAAHADTAAIAEPTVNLLGRLDQLLDAKARVDRAERFSRRALAIADASFPADDQRIAVRLNNLAELLRATNRLDEAEPLMRRALAIEEVRSGEDHPFVAIHLNNLALLLQATNRLEEAEPMMRRALSIDEASFGKDHPSVARDLNNLATLLRDTNRLDEAERLIRRVIDILEASNGKDHPLVAIALNNYAVLLQATNRLDKAEPPMRRALAIDEVSYGKDHPNVASRLSNLATLLQATNRLSEAESLTRRAVAIFLQFQRDTGHPHPDRDTAITNFWCLLAAIGKSQDEIAATIRGMLDAAGVSLD